MEVINVHGLVIACAGVKARYSIAGIIDSIIKATIQMKRIVIVNVGILTFASLLPKNPFQFIN